MVINKIKEKLGKKKAKHELLNVGAVVHNPGSTVDNKTGGWRSLRPMWIQEKCTQCIICWMHCPDDSIPQKDGKRLDFDYDYCKGCGICAQVCPFQAIEMKKEEK